MFFRWEKGLHSGGETFDDAASFVSRCFSVLSVSPWFISTAVSRCALVKLVTSWVKVPPVELDGSRPKRSVRDEAVRLNHKRDADGTVGS